MLNQSVFLCNPFVMHEGKGQVKVLLFFLFSSKFPNTALTHNALDITCKLKDDEFLLLQSSFPLFFSLSLLFFLSTASSPMSTPLLLASCFSDKTLIGISRDIFHCLLVTEALISLLVQDHSLFRCMACCHAFQETRYRTYMHFVITCWKGQNSESWRSVQLALHQLPR